MKRCLNKGIKKFFKELLTVILLFIVLFWLLIGEISYFSNDGIVNYIWRDSIILFNQIVYYGFFAVLVYNLRNIFNYVFPRC